MKNFFDCKDEKITEKAFSHNLIVSVLSILLCLVALCSMTYAWFTGGTSSNTNTLVAGHFNFKMSINKLNDDNTIALIDPTLTDEEQGAYTYNLSAGRYSVILDLTDDSTAKGYCIVKIGNVEKYTDVIIGDKTANSEGYTKNDPFTFILDVKKDTVVEFKPHWGVSASPFIQNDHTFTTDDWKPAPQEPGV